ncbi:hypothetical protein D5F01_LYC11111 [Xyrichtys novacula]|uniref:SGNH hydrolase-type esterase domain-containing protein n=1 Tax=Xyrichtys novacula TaxID=13765 RepID=A0AAV1G0A0_XYRNO|nr:hypothetical protein D5F01_LYC11111 [Xyrichtys novacula]
METLTSSHKCNSCLQKSKAIAELERRISSLHWIRNEELLLDSVLMLGADLPVNPAELDSTIPAAAAPQAPPAPAAAAAASGSRPSPAEAPAESARPQPRDPWLSQGARPKRVPAPALDFTPHPRFNIRSSNPWSTAAAKRRTSLKPHFDLQLSSRYDVLSVADFPPLPGRPDPGPADAGRSAVPPPSAAGKEEVNGVTHCFPGATVPTLLHKLLELLGSLTSSITRLVLHLGLNDTSSCQSEVTKDHIKKLFKVLTDCGKSVFISGPLPSFDRGMGRFSRLLSPNTWLHSACPCGFCFIDNFNLFWNRSPFYRADGVHPSRLGSRALGDNIRHAVQSTNTPTRTPTHTPTTR